jgi:hypothetical protein
MKNLLRAAEYVSTLRDRILTAIVERLIQIDVRPALVFAWVFFSCACRFCLPLCRLRL